MKAKARKLTRRAADAVLTLYCAFLTGGYAATLLLPGAWAERGYRGGIGGEWALILAAAWAGAYLYRLGLRRLIFGGVTYGKNR